MNKHYSKYLFSLLLFGSNGIFASMIDLTSYEIVFLRTLIGSILLILLFHFTGNHFTFFKFRKSFFMLVCSGMAMGISWIFLYEAYKIIGVSIASLCYYCGPVIVMALSPIIFKEKLTTVKITGFIAVLTGIFFINSSAMSEGMNSFGLFCGLMSAVMYSIMIIFNKKCTDIVGFENSVIQLSTSCLTVAVYILFKDSLLIHVPQSSILPLVVLGLLNSGIGCFLYFSSIGYLPVQSVSVLGYLEPLSAVILSVIFLKEAMTPLQVVGAFLIIGGAIWSENILQIKTGHAKNLSTSLQ